jgi:hypothetical protein
MRKTLRCILPLLAISTITLHSQHPATTTDLTSLLASEQSNYSLITYTQRYTDSDHGIVDYAGVLYLNLKSFSISQCKLKLDVVVQDKFAGTEHKTNRLRATTSSLGQKIVTYRYSYLLDLSGITDLHITSVTARPSQLRGDTSFSCQEDKQCRIEWLRLTSATPRIHETQTTGEILNFDQDVRDITIPVTSPDAAAKLADALGSLSAGCSSSPGKTTP